MRETMSAGRIVAGCLAPHPPHLVYATNPEQNEPRSSGAGAWQGLLDGYVNLRKSLESKDYDVLVVHTPHWRTVVGHHVLACPSFNGYSVDPDTGKIIFELEERPIPWNKRQKEVYSPMSDVPIGFWNDVNTNRRISFGTPPALQSNIERIDESDDSLGSPYGRM